MTMTVLGAPLQAGAEGRGLSHCSSLPTSALLWGPNRLALALRFSPNYKLQGMGLPSCGQWGHDSQQLCPLPPASGLLCTQPSHH